MAGPDSKSNRVSLIREHPLTKTTYLHIHQQAKSHAIANHSRLPYPLNNHPNNRIHNSIHIPTPIPLRCPATHQHRPQHHKRHITRCTLTLPIRTANLQVRARQLRMGTPKPLGLLLALREEGARARARVKHPQDIPRTFTTLLPLGCSPPTGTVSPVNHPNHPMETAQKPQNPNNSLLATLPTFQCHHTHSLTLPTWACLLQPLPVHPVNPRLLGRNRLSHPMQRRCKVILLQPSYQQVDQPQPG